MNLPYSRLKWSLTTWIFAILTSFGLMMLESFYSEDGPPPNLLPILQDVFESPARILGRLFGALLPGLLIFNHMYKRIYDSRSGLVATVYKDGLNDGRVKGLKNDITRVLLERFGEGALNGMQSVQIETRVEVLENALLHAFKCASADSFYLTFGEISAHYHDLNPV